ncbi:hypothetical protein BGZ72_007627 [Mortierella alpina]|nr:hypothetical protein BGZ72_007627 [Mortierella alpina]
MTDHRLQEQQTSGQGSALAVSPGANSVSFAVSKTTRQCNSGCSASTDVDAEEGSSCAAKGVASAHAQNVEVEPRSERTSDRKGKSVVRREDPEACSQRSRDVDACSARSTTGAFTRTRTGDVVDKKSVGEREVKIGAGSRVLADSSREGALKKRADEEEDIVEREEKPDEEENVDEDEEAGEGQEDEDEDEGHGSSEAVEDEEESADEIKQDVERQLAEKGKESVAEGKRPLRQACNRGDQAAATPHRVAKKDAATPTPVTSHLTLQKTDSVPTPPVIPVFVVNPPAPTLAPIRSTTASPQAFATNSLAPAQPASTQTTALNTAPAPRPRPPPVSPPALTPLASAQTAALNTAPAPRPPSVTPPAPAQPTLSQAAAANAAAAAAFSAFRFVTPSFQPPASRGSARASHVQVHPQAVQPQAPGAATSTSTSQPAVGNTGFTATSNSRTASTSNNSVINAVAAAAARSSGFPSAQPFIFTFPVAPATHLTALAPVVSAPVAGTPSTSATTIGNPSGPNAPPTVVVNRVLQAHQTLRADRRKRAQNQWLRNEQFRKQQAQTLRAIAQDQEKHRQQQLIQKQEEERERQSRLQAIQQIFEDGVRRYQAHGLPQTPFVYPSYVDNMWVHWSPAAALAPAKKALLSKHGSSQTSDARKKQQLFKSTWKKIEIRLSKYPYRPPVNDTPQIRGPRVKKVCAPLKRAHRSAQRTDQSTVQAIPKMPAVPTISVKQWSWPSNFPMTTTQCAIGPSTAQASAWVLHPTNPAPQQSTAVAMLQGDTEMQLSSQAAIRMWKYVPLHPDPQEATRLAFLNLCAAHGCAGFTFSGAVLEYGWTHLSQCLRNAGQVGDEVAIRNAQTVVDLRRTMSTWKYEPLHPDATTAAVLAHMDFDAANKGTAGSFGTLLMEMGWKHMDSCLTMPMDWTCSSAITTTITATAATATTAQTQPSQPQNTVHSGIYYLPTRLSSPCTTHLASAPCTVVPAPPAFAPLASAPLASPCALAPTHTPPTTMAPLPQHPFSFTPASNIAAAATIPQIAASAPTPTAHVAAASSLPATLQPPAGLLAATTSTTRTLGTLLAPSTAQQPDVPCMTASTNGTLFEQPQPSSAQDSGVGGSSTSSIRGDSAAGTFSRVGSPADSTDSDNTESATGTSDASESDSECKDEGGKELADSSDSSSGTSTHEQHPQSRKYDSSSRRRILEMRQSNRSRRQRHLHHRVLGSPIYDMVKLGLARLLPKGKRLLKRGLDRCLSRYGAHARLDHKAHDGHDGSTSCSARSNRSNGGKRMPARPRPRPYQKVNTKLKDSTDGNSEEDSDNSDDSGYHPSPSLSAWRHNNIDSNQADALNHSTVFEFSAPGQPPAAGESSTEQKNPKRARAQYRDDNQHYHGSSDDSYDGGDDTDDEQRPCKRRFKQKQAGDTKDDSDHRPATSADALARAVRRLRRVIDAVPEADEVFTPSDLEFERAQLLKASEVVFFNQARQYNPSGSTAYTPVPRPSNPTRNDTASYTLPPAEAVSYAPGPEAKDANLGATAAAAARLDFLKAKAYYTTYNLPDRHRPLRSGAASELKTMMDQNILRRRAAAEEMNSDGRDETLLDDDKPRKFKSRRVE